MYGGYGMFAGFEDLPNTDVLIRTTRKLAQIKVKILQVNVFVILENGVVGSLQINSKNFNGVLNDKTLNNLKVRILTDFKMYGDIENDKNKNITH